MSKLKGLHLLNEVRKSRSYRKASFNTAKKIIKGTALGGFVGYMAARSASTPAEREQNSSYGS
jgi:hypothetical protein